MIVWAFTDGSISKVASFCSTGWRGDIALINTAGLVGIAFGGVAMGFLADRVGVRPVAMLIRSIRQCSILEEGIHPTGEVRMHGGRITTVQPGVRHRHDNVLASVTQLLGDCWCRTSAVVARNDLCGLLIKQAHLRRKLDPEHGIRCR